MGAAQQEERDVQDVEDNVRMHLRVTPARVLEGVHRVLFLWGTWRYLFVGEE